MQTKKQKISQILGVVAIGTVLGLSLQFVRAWSEPNAAAPTGNVAAPLNVGTTTQVKSGALGIGGILSVQGQIINKTGGIKFPDGTVQTTAAASSVVAHGIYGHCKVDTRSQKVSELKPPATKIITGTSGLFKKVNLETCGCLSGYTPVITGSTMVEYYDGDNVASYYDLNYYACYKD